MNDAATQKPAPALPPELASLLGEAQAIGGMPGQAPADPAGMPPAPAPQQALSLELTNAETIAGMLEGVRDMAAEFGGIKSLDALTTDNIKKLAAIWAPVLARRNVNLAAVGGANMDIFFAALATVTIARPIVAALREEYQQKKGLALAQSDESATKK